MDFQRNNLDQATSPYLQQHQDNPIFWQEWSPQVLAYAKQTDKPILASSGYATCHWCHAMAHDTFEDQSVADFLNKNFISIKVDREQRPDIDEFMTNFAIQTQGRAGWPMQVVFTPDVKPFAAFTYLPAKPKLSKPAFTDVMQEIYTYYNEYKDKITPFKPVLKKEQDIAINQLKDELELYYDYDYGGFGSHAKFPSQTILIFLIHFFEHEGDPVIGSMLEQTLRVIALRGLHDHLQGGFFRYCVDRTWTIPHFEKMLYDQALLLWVYALAFQVFKKPLYKKVAEKIIDCLQDTFKGKDLYYAALDADTNGKEGATYIWSYQELQDALSHEAFSRFQQVYDVSKQGNIEGVNHLVKRKETCLADIEQQLLQIRKKRAQPFIDRKYITSWNGLTGIGFVMAYRYLGDTKALEKAQRIFKALMATHADDQNIYHSSIDNVIQKKAFLQDIASVLLLATYLYEDTGDYKSEIEKLYRLMHAFYKDNQWYEAIGTDDFMQMPARYADQALPASAALAQYARIRSAILLDEDYKTFAYYSPLQNSFWNLSSFLSQGYMHVIKTPEKIDWRKLPINSIQLPSDHIADCYAGSCSTFDSIQEFLVSLRTG